MTDDSRFLSSFGSDLTTVRALLAALAVFDLVLGGVAVGFPDLYVSIVHPHFAEMYPDGPTYLVQRTGVIWLFFAGVQGAAAAGPDRRPWLVFLAGALRLMDVPADLVYVVTADDMSTLTTLAVTTAPLGNALAGTYLVTRPPVRELLDFECSNDSPSS